MMQAALQMLRSGYSQNAVEQHSGILCRTIRNHLKTGSTCRSLGRKSILSVADKEDLVMKIVRFAEKGFQLTPKILRRSVFRYYEIKNLRHNFNTDKGRAGKEWCRSFLKRHNKNMT